MPKAANVTKPAKPRKPRTRTCPACGSTAVAPIMYGYPSNMDETLKAAKEGHISLGGCVIEEDAPKWRCTACHHGWGRLGY